MTHDRDLSEGLSRPGFTSFLNTIPCNTETRNTRDDEEWLKIELPGTQFKIKLDTLLKHPDSRLGKLAVSLKKGGAEPARELTASFNRNPAQFGVILDAYRMGRLHIPRDACLNYFTGEMKFWGLPESCLARCCWVRYDTYKTEQAIIMENVSNYESDKESIDLFTKLGSIRWQVWKVLEYPQSSIPSKVIH